MLIEAEMKTQTCSWSKSKQEIQEFKIMEVLIRESGADVFI